MLKHTCQTMLAPHEEILEAVTLSGFRRYATDYGHVSAAHSARTRANIIHDHIIEDAKRALPSPRFRPIPKIPRNLFDFEGSLTIQFKKLGHDFRTSNIPTFAALAIEANGGSDCLPGIPDRIPLVTVGYVPKEDWSGVEGVFVTFVQDGQLQWHYGISTEGLMIQFPPVSPQVTPPHQIHHATDPTAPKRRLLPPPPAEPDIGFGQAAS